MGAAISIGTAVFSCAAMAFGACFFALSSAFLKCCCLPFTVPFKISSISHAIYMIFSPLIFWGLVNLPPNILSRFPFGVVICQNPQSSTIAYDPVCYRNEIWTRTFFALIIFYFIIWLGSLLGARISRTVQTSYPLPKFFFFLVLIFLSMFIPSSFMGLVGYACTWSPLWILPIFMAYTLDFGYLCNESLVKLYIDSGKKVYPLISIASSLSLLLLSVVFYIFAFIYISPLSLVTVGSFAGINVIILLISISNIAEHGALLTTAIAHGVSSGHYLIGLYFFTKTVKIHSIPPILYFGTLCTLLIITLLYSIGRFGYYVDVFHTGSEQNVKAVEDAFESVTVPSSTEEGTITRAVPPPFTEKQTRCTRFQNGTYVSAAMYILALGLYFGAIPYNGLNHLLAFFRSQIIGSCLMVGLHLFSLLVPRLFPNRSF